MESFEPAFDYISPGVELNTHLGVFILDHYNTRIREFEEPNQIFNHIEFAITDEEGKRRVIGINPDEEIMQKFKEMGFPRLIMPFVDEHTANWLVATSSKDLEAADSVDKFLEGGDDDAA